MPSTAEVLGRVPSNFVWLRPGLQMMQDPLDGQLVYVDDDGRVVGRGALPEGFRIAEIGADAREVRLTDSGGRQQIVIPRALDPRTAPRMSPVAIDRGPSKAKPSKTPSSGAKRQGNEPPPPATAKRLDVKSLSGGALATTYEIPSGADGERYVVSEEIISSKPSLVIRVIVQRFDRDGAVTGVAHVPLDGMDVVPRDFIAVTDNGMLRVLTPTNAGVKIRQISFSPPPFLNSTSGRMRDEDIRALGDPGPDIDVQTTILKQTERLDPVLDVPRFGLRITTPPVTRQKVVENARAYLRVNWVLATENFARPQISNQCAPERARYWERPATVTANLIGKTIGPMPYRWGGDDTPESFKLRLQVGALAGDVCTCRSASYNYCLVEESAGVDCSGFVSKAWGIAKRGTWGLLDVAKELDDIAEMRPGDAFVRPGNHVRLFTGKDSNGGYAVLESSTTLRCQGVCESNYRPSELSRFRLIQYSGITE